MKTTKLLLIPALAAMASPALAGGFYFDGSISSTDSNLEFQSHQSRYGSVTAGVRLGRLLRIGLTHSQELAINDGYVDSRTEDELRSSNATPANANDDPADDGN